MKKGRRKQKEERQVDVKRRGGKLKIDVKNKEDTNWFFIMLLIFICLMMIIFASYFFVMSGKMIMTGNVIASYQLCYQESVNTTNQKGTDGGIECGLNYNGNYYTPMGSSLTDPIGHYMYINYTRPNGAQPSSKWKVKHGSIEANFSIPLDCWNAYANGLLFRVESIAFAPINPPNYISFSNITCSNGNKWIQISYDLGSGSNCDYSVDHKGFPNSMYDGDWNTYAANKWGWVTCSQYTYSNSFIFEEAMIWNVSSVSGCEDSLDGGDNPVNPGSVITNSTTITEYKDACINSYYLNEAVCDASNVSRYSYKNYDCKNYFDGRGVCLNTSIPARGIFGYCSDSSPGTCDKDGKCEIGEGISNCALDCSQTMFSNFGFQESEDWLGDRKGNFPLVVYGSPEILNPFINNLNQVVDIGVEDYFVLQNSNSYTPNKISVSAWIDFSKGSIPKESEIISKGTGSPKSSDYSYVFGIQENNSFGIRQFLFARVNVNYLGESYTIERRADITSFMKAGFNQVAFSYDNTTGSMSLYLNGKLLNSKGCDNSERIYKNTGLGQGCIIKPYGFSPSTIINNRPWIISFEPYVGISLGMNYFFNGGLDELKIWNYPLTSTEIKDIYNSELQLFGEQISVIAYYNLEENLYDSKSQELDLESDIDSDEINYNNEIYCDNKYLDSKTNSSLVLYRLDANELEFSGNQAFAISFWTKLYGNEGKYSDIISKNENYRIGAKDNKLSFSVKKASGSWATITTTKEVPLNKWIFVTAVYNGTKIKLFVNGTKMKEASVGEELTYNEGGNFVVIANSGDGQEDFEAKCTDEDISASKCHFNGAIDELAIISGIINDSGVKKIYESENIITGFGNGYNKGTDYFFCSSGGRSNNPQFSFRILTCADSECINEKSSFAKGENFYLTYDIMNDSRGLEIDENYFSNINVSVKITSASGEVTTKQLPTEVSFNTLGTYLVRGTAKKSGYLTKTFSFNFLIKSGGTTPTTRRSTFTTLPPSEECNNDGFCDSGEDSNSCPEDCSATSSSSWLKISIVLLIIAIICTGGIVLYLKYQQNKEKSLDDLEEEDDKNKEIKKKEEKKEEEKKTTTEKTSSATAVKKQEEEKKPTFKIELRKREEKK